MAILIVVMSSFAIHSYSIYQISFRKNSSLVIVFLAVLSVLTAFLSIAYFLLNSYQKHLQAQRTLISDFGDEVEHISPSIFGWVACGRDWIASSNPPQDFQKLSVSEIENFTWGNSDGVFEKYVDYPEFSFPRIAVAGLRKRFWILVPSSTDPMNTLLLLFYKKSDMQRWVSIIRAMIGGETQEVVGFDSPPSQWKVARKARLLIILWALLCVLAQFAGLYATTSMNSRIVSEVSYAVLLLAIISSMAWSDTTSIFKMFMGVRFRLAGGKKQIFDSEDPAIIRNQLLLTSGSSQTPGLEFIPISTIKDLHLENWGHSFAERDLLQLFKKDAMPKSMTLRLYLDDANDPEREIKLPTAVAERWYSELKELIDRERMV